MAKNVTAPRRWRSSPDSPPTQLAYVTQPEIDLLVDANIHGSMKGKPNRGPNGIMSLDGDYVMSWSPPSQSSSGGGNGGGPAPSIDYGSDDSGGFIGEGWGGNPPPAPAPAPAPVIDSPDPTGGDDPEKADYWVPTKEIIPKEIDHGFDTIAQNQSYQDMLDRQKDMQAALKIQQLHGGSTGNINKWSDQELMQAQAAGLFAGEAEGMLGGVTGYEKEVNQLKKAISSHMGKKYTQGINPMKGLESLPEFKALMKLHETGSPVDMPAQQNSILTVVNAIGVENAIKYKIIDPNDPATKNFLAQTTGDIGYDPTGRYTYEDVQGDPALKEAYEKLLSGKLKPHEIRQYAHFLDYGISDPNQNQNQGGYGYRNRYGGGQRDRNLALLQFLQGGSPIKQLEKSPFMAGMKAAYQDAPETLSEGLFSKIIPGGAFNPKAMKRLVKSWGSGYTNPRYANVAARGGIMSAWNNMRR
jgi:hypothetical protein